MNPPSKPTGTASGQPETPMQQFKQVWRQLPEAEQYYWREQFDSTRTQADLRAEIFRTYRIRLSGDGKLSLFRAWLEDQDQRDAQAERLKENAARLPPDWTLDQMREAVLKACYAEALATGDFKLGLRTVVQDLNVKKFNLAREKFEFRAAEAALAVRTPLRNIKDNSGLTEDEKILQARILLFGEEAVLGPGPDDFLGQPNHTPPAENQAAGQTAQGDGESEQACVTPDSNSDLEMEMAEGPASSPDSPRADQASQPPPPPSAQKPSRRENGA